MNRIAKCLSITDRERFARCREMWDKYERFDRVSPEDTEYLMNYVFPLYVKDGWTWYANFENKDIDFVYVDIAQCRTKCFYLQFKDGTHSRISVLSGCKAKNYKDLQISSDEIEISLF